MNTRGWRSSGCPPQASRSGFRSRAGSWLDRRAGGVPQQATPSHLAGSLSGHLKRYLLRCARSSWRRVLPAPANTAKFLEFTYGSDWASDPAFLFEHRRQTSQDGALVSAVPPPVAVLAGVLQERRVRRVPTEPSWFAEWVDAQIEPRAAEAGQAQRRHGRDAPSCWFTEQGHPDRLGLLRRGPDRGQPDRTRLAGVPVTFSSINPESLYSVLVNAARIAHEPVVGTSTPAG